MDSSRARPSQVTPHGVWRRSKWEPDLEWSREAGLGGPPSHCGERGSLRLAAHGQA